MSFKVNIWHCHISKTVYPKAHSFTFLSDGSDPGSKMPLGRCWIRPIRCAMRTCSSSVSWQASRLSPGLGWYTGSGCVCSWKRSNCRWGVLSLKYTFSSILQPLRWCAPKSPGCIWLEPHQLTKWGGGGSPGRLPPSDSFSSDRSSAPCENKQFPIKLRPPWECLLRFAATDTSKRRSEIS